jgi:hypothetical protein
LVIRNSVDNEILDVNFTLNKNEEYESGRKEKLAKESYLASSLVQRIE